MISWRNPNELELKQTDFKAACTLSLTFAIKMLQLEARARDERSHTRAHTAHGFMLLGKFIKHLFFAIFSFISFASLALLSGIVVWTVKQQESVHVLRLENHLHHNLFVLLLFY